MSHQDELMKIAKEAEDVDPIMAEEMKKVAEEIGELDEEEGMTKEAKLMNPGDKVICVNPIQGLYKGRIYMMGRYVGPNAVMIKEQTGTPVGIFRADRFLPDWNTF